MIAEHLVAVSWLLATASLVCSAAGCGAPSSAGSGKLPAAERAPRRHAATARPQPLTRAVVPVANDEPARAAADALAEQLVWVMRAHGNHGARLSADGRTVLYASSRAGRWAVYRAAVAAPERVPERLWTCPRRCSIGRQGADGRLEVVLSAEGPPRERVWLNPADRGVEPGAPAGSSEVVTAAAAPAGEPVLAIRNAACGQRVVIEQGPAERPIELPLGAGQLGAPSLTAHRLTLSWSTPLEPAEIYAIDDGSGAHQRLRNEVRPALAALGDARVEVVHVGRTPGLLLRPSGDTSALLVTIGSTRLPAARWDPVARTLAGRGVAVLVPCLGGSPPAASVLEALGRWLRAQSWTKPGAPLWVVNAGPTPGAADGPVPPPFAGALELPWWWAVGAQPLDRAHHTALLLEHLTALRDGS